MMDLKLQPEGLRLDIGKSFLGTVGWIRLNCSRRLWNCHYNQFVPNKMGWTSSCQKSHRHDTIPIWRPGTQQCSRKSVFSNTELLNSMFRLADRWNANSCQLNHGFNHTGRLYLEKQGFQRPKQPVRLKEPVGLGKDTIMKNPMRERWPKLSCDYSHAAAFQHM